MTFAKELAGGTGSSYTWDTNFNPNYGCTSAPCNGLEFIITIQSIPDVSVTSITDDYYPTPNTYFKAIELSSPYNTDGLSIWYARAGSTADTDMILTINFATSCTTCVVDLFYSNLPLSFANSFSGVPIRIQYQGNAVPTLNNNINSNVLTFSGSQQFLVINDIAINGTTDISYTTNPPLVSTRQVTASYLGGLMGWQVSQTAMTPAGGKLSQSFSTLATSTTTNSYSCGTLGIYKCENWDGAMVTVVFVQATIQPPSCQNCGITGGGGTKGTTIFSLTMPNETLLYIQDAPVGGAMIQNITTEVNYTNSGAGKSIDYIYVCIYELPSGTLQGTTAISSSNPLHQSYCTIIHSISTGQTNQFIHWYPNVLVPPSTTFAITIMSRFTGLSLYQDTVDNIVLNGDTADYTGTAGEPPINLSNFFIVNPPIWFFFTGSQTSITTTQNQTIQTITTITCLSGSTCTTATTTVLQTFTSIIYSMQGTAGAVANIQDIIAFLPVWVLPLIMGVLFGVIGLLFGGVVGLGMGIMLGIIPLWFAFLLGLGIVFILFKRVI